MAARRGHASRRRGSPDPDRVRPRPRRWRSTAGKLVTHRQLLREVWGPAYETETHYLRVHFAHLRAKIEPDPSHPRYIVTDPGVGYRLRDD